MSKITDFLKDEKDKVIAWIQSKEPAFIKATKQAYAITTALLGWVASPAGKTVEEVLDAVIPKGEIWTADAIKIATAFATDMAALSNPASWRGIALRAGGELLSLIDGGKLPTGLDGYIAEFQQIFVG